MTRVNRRLVNPVLGRAAGRFAPLALLRHHGRRSGRRYQTPVFAFADDGMITIALTYGSDVQWLSNVRAAGGCDLVHKGRELRLGPPTLLDADTGMARMPAPIRAVLRATRVTEFVEFPVLERA
jgi:deazaflavin-dependent oxidoreductase (nitroreductase family)